MASHHQREMKRGLANEHDFVVRRRSNLWLQLCGLLLVAFGAVFLGFARTHNGSDSWEFVTVLLLVLGTLGIIGYIQVQRHRDLLLLTEFQNALFTSTARLNFRFCLITKRDGSIVYYDPGFQTMFPEMQQQNHSAIDDIFARKELPEEVTREMTRLLQHEEHGVLLFPYRSSEGKQVNMVVHIDPLQKPKGYVAIRGREYVEHRHSALGGSDADDRRESDNNVAVSALQQQLLAQTPTPAYAVDAQGKLIFANSSFERALGYDAGDLNAVRPAISSLLYQAAGSPIGRDSYEGEAVFLHRSGNLARFSVQQSRWADNQGHNLGSYGFLLPLHTA